MVVEARRRLALKPISARRRKRSIANGTNGSKSRCRRGGALNSAAHASGAFERFTALDGTFEIRSGKATQKLEAGETARYCADVEHRIANVGPIEARGPPIVLYG